MDQMNVELDACEVFCDTRHQKKILFVALDTLISF